MSWIKATCANCASLYFMLNVTTATRSCCLECLEVRLNHQDVDLEKQKNELDLFQRKVRFLGYHFDSDAADQEGDTMIIVGGRRDEPLFVHKLILSSKSSVLCNMFKSKVMEEQTGIVCIDDASLNAIRAMVRFCYVAEVDFTEAPAEEVLEVAHKYGLALLQERCEDHLAKTMDKENMSKRMVIANKFHSTIVTEAASQLLKDNFDEAFPIVLSEVLKKF